MQRADPEGPHRRQLNTIASHRKVTRRGGGKTTRRPDKESAEQTFLCGTDSRQTAKELRHNGGSRACGLTAAVTFGDGVARRRGVGCDHESGSLATTLPHACSSAGAPGPRQIRTFAALCCYAWLCRVRIRAVDGESSRCTCEWSATPSHCSAHCPQSPTEPPMEA